MQVISSIIHHNYCYYHYLSILSYLDFHHSSRSYYFQSYIYTGSTSFLATINVFRFYFYHVLMKMLPFFFLNLLYCSHSKFFLWCCSLSFIEKFRVVIASIPLPIAATLYCVVFFYAGQVLIFYLLGWILNYQSILSRGKMMFIAIVYLNLEE